MKGNAELGWRMFICDEENQLLSFLKSNPNVYFSGGELCRKRIDLSETWRDAGGKA